MNVRVTVLSVPPGDAELAADRMMTAGAFAVEERDAGRVVELRAVLGDDDAARARLGALPSGWSLGFEDVDPTPLDTWRQFAEPVEVAPDLVVRPAWLPPLDRAGVVEVAIEPGATFGLGDHPTTRASAAAVWRLAGAASTVLDVGAGSGVLAIVGLLGGADRALAIDVSEESPAVVVDNARRNGVEGRIDASTRALSEVADTFDLVVANILAPVLIALAHDLRRVTAPDGALVVSGMLAGHHDHVVEALEPMRVVQIDEVDGWVAIELRHPVS